MLRSASAAPGAERQAGGRIRGHEAELTKMQNVTQDDYLAKIFQKASKYIYNYDNQVLNDNGKRKANNVKLYNNALQVVNLINEHTD